MSHFVEHLSTGQRIYDAMLLESRNAGVLGSDVAMSILSALSEENQCPMDVARKLKINEQKVYYYLRGLEKAGIVKKVGEEPRYGMTAKIYSVVSPVVAIKLHEKARVVPSSPATDVALIDFFHPFVENGELNAKIIFGDPYPHGEHGESAKEGVHAFDIAMLIGGLARNMAFPSYLIDTDVEDRHLKDNIILIGNAKTNTIIRKMEQELPVSFKDNRIISKKTKKAYEGPIIGVIAKTKNPYDSSKSVLVISGIRTRGMRAAVLAITTQYNKLLEHSGHSEFVRIVEGIDKDGDKIIDDVKILE
ncbi:MAG: ArsR family transcriptional regulator [Candidatus Aenigmarchaeota archaeon]|nr:ArsR family transcriptional regulator [Candidatus Aenigmarchaeota archaeon]